MYSAPCQSSPAISTGSISYRFLCSSFSALTIYGIDPELGVQRIAWGRSLPTTCMDTTPFIVPGDPIGVHGEEVWKVMPNTDGRGRGLNLSTFYIVRINELLKVKMD